MIPDQHLVRFRFHFAGKSDFVGSYAAQTEVGGRSAGESWGAIDPSEEVLTNVSAGHRQITGGW